MRFCLLLRFPSGRLGTNRLWSWELEVGWRSIIDAPEITRVEGLRNDLLLQLDRSEIESALLSIANRDRLMALPGIPRHREATDVEARGIDGAKVPLEAHLQRLGILGNDGKAARRAIAVSNRNLGTNHGHLAWQRHETPRIFAIREDPRPRRPISCLTSWVDGRVSIDELRFDYDADRVYEAHTGRDVVDEVDWATSGQRVARRTRLSDRRDRGSLLRHPARAGIRSAARRGRSDEAGDLSRLPGDVPRQRPSRLARSRCPRARYVHNAVGVSADGLFIVQREGTVEEIGDALKSAGATAGLIVDNGGSVACWVWWANLYAGGIISPTVDYRPPGTSAIAFVLKGPMNVELPGGSVSYSVV